MKLFLSLLLLCLTFSVTAQNVGISQPKPTERLDVNGNINISGTIKANGVAGTPGQILMSTGAGLTWGNVTGYKKCVQFYEAGTFHWTVPAGVTEVMVELWGGGSGGTGAVGGTSGGYGRTIKTVLPGSVIDLNVGSGGPTGSTESGEGGFTRVYFSDFAISAYGGGGVRQGVFGLSQSGSVYSGNTDNAFFMYCNAGTANAVTFGLTNASTYVQIINYGSGGAPFAMLNSTPMHGSIVRLENGSVVGVVRSADSHLPGAGGVAGQVLGVVGGDGMIVFWFN